MDRRGFLTTSAAAAGALALPASFASAASLADQTRNEAFVKLFMMQCHVNNRWQPISINNNIGMLAPPLKAMIGGVSYTRDENVLTVDFFEVLVPIDPRDIYQQYDVLEFEEMLSRLRTDCDMTIETNYIVKSRNAS